MYYRSRCFEIAVFRPRGHGRNIVKRLSKNNWLEMFDIHQVKVSGHCHFLCFSNSSVRGPLVSWNVRGFHKRKIYATNRHNNIIKHCGLLTTELLRPKKVRLDETIPLVYCLYVCYKSTFLSHISLQITSIKLTSGVIAVT